MNNNQKEIESKKLSIEVQGNNIEAVEKMIKDLIPQLKELMIKEDTYLYLKLNCTHNGVDVTLATNSCGFDGHGCNTDRQLRY